MRARHIALVSISAAALTTSIAGTALGLDRRVEAWIADAVEPPAPVVVPEDELRPLPIRPAAAPVAPATPAPAAPEPADLQPTVPDLDGLRVGQARRLLRERGLRLVVRDEEGRAIAPEDGASYRVRGASMDPPAGAPIEPGATVRARARLRMPRILSGY